MQGQLVDRVGGELSRRALCVRANGYSVLRTANAQDSARTWRFSSDSHHIHNDVCVFQCVAFEAPLSLSARHRSTSGHSRGSAADTYKEPWGYRNAGKRDVAISWVQHVPRRTA